MVVESKLHVGGCRVRVREVWNGRKSHLHIRICMCCDLKDLAAFTSMYASGYVEQRLECRWKKETLKLISTHERLSGPEIDGGRILGGLGRPCDVDGG